MPGGPAGDRQAARTHGTVLSAPTAPAPRTGALTAPEASLTGPQLSDIAVNYLDGASTWTPSARTAFEAAVQVWEHRVASPVPIRVNAYATTFADPRILGGAGPTGFVRNTRGTATTADDVYEASALSDARTGTASADADIEAEFNPGMSGLYFGTDGLPGNAIDFESVVLHELGHGLGLLGTADLIGGVATVGFSNNGARTGSSWDVSTTAATAGGTRAVMSLPDGSTELAQALTGGALRWSGAAGVRALGGPAPLYAPGSWEPGSSYSHLDEATFGAGSANALMTPVLRYGEVVHDPGPLALGMLRDMGYTVDGGTSSGAIDALYRSLGGAASRLGATTGAELPGRDGSGAYRTYAGGAIYWSPGTGAHEVYGAILAAWRALGAELSALGYPTTGELATPDGRGRYTHFSVGSVYWTPATGAREVRGTIRATWAQLGWELSPLGYPVTDELGTPDGAGRYNHFQSGSIYWSPATGAHEVRGAIRDAWQALGWERSALGYPVTGELGTPDGVGRYTHFQVGSIYWSAATGAHEVRGSIRTAWADAGWERSYLGYPTSNEFAVPGGRASDFQGGRATWSARTNAVTLTPR